MIDLLLLIAVPAAIGVVGCLLFVWYAFATAKKDDGTERREDDRD